MQEVMMEGLEGVDQKIKPESSTLRDGPLFVVGMFRSGTSLLYALLNQNPQIALMYEGDLAHLHSLFWFPTKTSRWLAKWDFWNGGPSRHKVDTSKLPANIADLKSAVREVYVEYARQKKGATIWGCKSPTYYDSIARLGRTFPNARFVIIWRDLHDVCRSIRKAAEQPTYFRRRGMLLRAMMGYHDMKVQCDWLVSHGLPVYEIYYEDLVSDSEATIRGICEFLQIPFDPRMITLKGADRSAIEDATHHSLVKTERIVKPKKNKPPTLPTALEAKIDRYLFSWRKQYGGAWPRYPRSLNGEAGGPSIWERSRDQLAYRGLRMWHHSIPVIFSLVPMRAWYAYSRFRGRSFEWREERPGRTEGAGDRDPKQ
jgi:hypothetical protein